MSWDGTVIIPIMTYSSTSTNPRDIYIFLGLIQTNSKTSAKSNDHLTLLIPISPYNELTTALAARLASLYVRVSAQLEGDVGAALNNDRAKDFMSPMPDGTRL